MDDVYWLEQEQADVPGRDHWFGARELETLSGLHILKRRADWRLGRWTAKLAVSACLKLPLECRSLREVEICTAPSGAPRVLVAGEPGPVVISISHSNGLACCAVAASGASLGCDLEWVEPHGEAFLADYFTDAEQALVAASPPAERCRLVTLLWSGKESVLKALCTGLRLDTRCLTVRPAHSDGPDRWHPLRVRHEGGRIFQGWWRSAGSFVRTLIAAPPPLPPVLLGVPGGTGAAQPACGAVSPGSGAETGANCVLSVDSASAAVAARPRLITS